MTKPLEFRIPADHGHVRFLRGDVREGLESLGVPELKRDQIVLVIDEIVSNAIDHGGSYRVDGDQLLLRITVCESAVDLEFHDPSAPIEVVDELGRILDELRNGPPPFDNERGRGLFLIRDGLDELRIAAADDGDGLRLFGRILRETG